MTDLHPWVKPVTTVTLFVDDLATARQFYEEVLGLPIIYADDNSAVCRFPNLQINLLDTEAAGVVVEPAPVGDSAAGVRVLLTVTVDDVDAVCQELQRRGVTMLNGPVDRPWGVRTAAFADPAGHVWEIAT